MRVLLINNDGGGYCDYVEVENGTTVAHLVERTIKSRDPSAYLIRVNRMPVHSAQMLQPEDRVSITPTKIEGALS